MDKKFWRKFRIMLNNKDEYLKSKQSYALVDSRDINWVVACIQGYIDCAFDLGNIDLEEVGELRNIADCLREEWMDEYKHNKHFYD